MELLEGQAKEKEGSLWKYVLEVEWGSMVRMCACTPLVGVFVTFPIAVTRSNSGSVY